MSILILQLMRILISHLVAKLENHTSADIRWVLNEYYSSPQYKWCHFMAQLLDPIFSLDALTLGTRT